MRTTETVHTEIRKSHRISTATPWVTVRPWFRTNELLKSDHFHYPGSITEHECYIKRVYPYKLPCIWRYI